MAFDPTSAQEESILAPTVSVGFDPTSAKLDSIPFDKLIQIESGGNQFSRLNNKPLTSNKGAVGIAQLLPATAKDAAKMAGLEWNQEKFYKDADYNKTLGEAYYNKQLEEFGGDSFKAAAAYNAGPARVKKLVETFGDKWAEKLPPETKNYIAKLGYQGVATPEQGTYTPETSANPIIDYGQLAEAGKFGAGVGAVVALAPQAKGIVGAVRGGSAILPAIARGGSVGDIAAAGAKGFTEGVLGSGVGQVYQYGKPENLETDLERMGIEIATGGGATAVYEGGLNLIGKTTKALPTWIGDVVEKPLRALTGKTELEKNLAANAFGRLKINPGTTTDTFRNATYARQADNLNSFGIQIPKGEIPSDYVRNQMYAQTRQLENQGIKWKDSAQYTQLMSELDMANTPKDVKQSIKNLANSQGGNLAEASAKFEKNLLNLTQQSGGDFKYKDMSEIASSILRKNVNNFYLQHTGVPYFNLVKDLEKEGFAALAHDSLPTLISNGFAKNDKTKDALSNIKNSPNGVSDLKIAVGSYLKTVDEKKLLNEWNDLEQVLIDTKALPLEEIRALRKQVNVAKSLTSRGKTTAALLAKDGIVTALGAEKARATKDRPKATLSSVLEGDSAPLGAFSL
jgi:hypothetical protein